MSLVSYPSRATLAPSVLPLPTDITISLHRLGPRPFEARQFERREFEGCDVHGFLSLKEARHVEVDGITAIAVALSLECNPKVVAYTECPSNLQVGDSKVELDFWVRVTTDYEELLLLGDGDCLGVVASAPRPREFGRLQAAGDVAGISLSLRFAKELS